MAEWYNACMDVNVKNLDAAVVERLAEQAAAEGMSQQEWMRQILRRTAERLSPAEVVTQRARITPMSGAEFDALTKRVARRRRNAVEAVDARSRRR